MRNILPSALRQPPSPLDHRRRQDSTIAGNTETVGDNYVTVNSRTQAFYARRCKNKSLSTSLESLPDDLVLKILLHLPAQDIYDLARLVCRTWYPMIHTRYFVYEHLQHSPSGLLFQCWKNQNQNPILLTMREGRIEISTFNYKFKREVLESCNGLILEYENYKNERLYITNPATEQQFALPLCGPRINFPPFTSIAYVAASMEYKVVLTEFWNRERPCLILTVGVDDSWRNVCTEHLPRWAKNMLYLVTLTTEGFIHWAKAGGPEVLTMNVETEIITETPVPIPRVYVEEEQTLYLSTGRYLTFLMGLGNLKWEGWEMKPETGEWRKMPKIIDLEAHKFRFEEQLCNNGILRPFGWLNYPEVLVFGVEVDTTEICFAYKFHTNEIELIELPKCSMCYGTLLHHKNSLVRLGGC